MEDITTEVLKCIKEQPSSFKTLSYFFKMPNEVSKAIATLLKDKKIVKNDNGKYNSI